MTGFVRPDRLRNGKSEFRSEWKEKDKRKGDVKMKI